MVKKMNVETITEMIIEMSVLCLEAAGMLTIPRPVRQNFINNFSDR